MELGRFFTSLALAVGVAGGALAQQAEQPAPPAPPKEYNQQFLVPGSWFHGVHGLAFNKDDQLFAGSVIGQTIYRVQVDSGEVDRVIDRVRRHPGRQHAQGDPVRQPAASHHLSLSHNPRSCRRPPATPGSDTPGKPRST